MEYTHLGQTDIRVSKMCVGAMSFGKAGMMHQWSLDPDATASVVKHALDLGINFFDTANCYSKGTSEEYLGKALKAAKREDVVISSKVSGPTTSTSTSFTALTTSIRSRKRWRLLMTS